MTLKTTMATEITSVFSNTDEFAQVISYGGADIIALTIDYLNNPEVGPHGTAIRATIIVAKSTVATPDDDYRTEVVIDGVTWLVSGMLEGDDLTWTIGLFRDERILI